MRTLLVLVATILALTVAPDVAQAQFGAASFTASASTRQAGAHADLSVSFELNHDPLGNPIGQLKSATVELPPGVVGDPQAVPRCTEKDFLVLACGPQSQIGTLDTALMVCQGVSSQLEAPAEEGATTITVANTEGFCVDESPYTITIGSGASAETAEIYRVGSSTTLELGTPLKHSHSVGETVSHVAEPKTLPLPLFNLQPSPGHLATFGASMLFATIIVQVDMRSNGALVAKIQEASTLLTVASTGLTLWGVPADPSHDPQRCTEYPTECKLSAGVPDAPFMTNPAQCSGPPLESKLAMESWQGQTATSATTLPPPTGCEALQISPSLKVSPDTTSRDTPAGYEFDVRLPQNEEPLTNATPPLQNISITLPSGTSLSPAFANGLQTCSDEQFNSGSESSCPSASKVGTAEVATPLLASHLSGVVYMGVPTASEKYRIFVLLSGDKTTLRLEGEALPNPSTGQVTALFKNVPPLPFSEFKLVFFGGPSAAFANPATCGPASSTSQITAYSGQTAEPSSTFQVGGLGGEPCPASEPFTPSFMAGTTSPLAGGFSPFTLTVSRGDGQQSISSISAQLPLGLLAMLSAVAPCPEPQASQGDCPQASQVGTSTIAAGAGSQPLYLTGSVYLTSSYKGAPYGLSIVVPAVAGPFDLGTIVTRAQVLVNPTNLRMTIASDPLPQIVGGIPLRLRTVNLTMNRSDFMFNPTSCASQSVTGTVYSAEGASAVLSTPFTTSGCTGLPFAPKLTASTEAKASSQGNGASLEVQIANPGGPHANISSVTTQLPGRLRPRLSTIQQACESSIYSTNPTACPKGSLVGTVAVGTPVLSSPLTGSVYLVFRGASSSPEFMAELQGQGLKAQLEAAISVSSKGTITTTFKGLPDVPVSSFHLQFSRGPHSMLGAIEGLCTGKLLMPYVINAENGAHVKHTLQVAVKGCPKRATGKQAARKARRAKRS
jgi:hypothetical protein